MRRAFKTAYYLNRALPRLALVGRGVRLPNTAGVWVPVSDGAKKRCEVVRILSLFIPELPASASRPSRQWRNGTQDFGSNSSKVVPPGSTEVTPTVPPCASTI